MTTTSRTILVVDDEKDIVDLLRYNLSKEGYSVLTAVDGKQALEQAQRDPDVILLDVMMPGYDGWDVMKRLKRNEHTARIPVIFLTAKGSEVDEVVGLELGAEDYIVKPIRIATLIARIKAVLRKKEDVAEAGLETTAIRIGAIEILPTKHIVRVSGKEIFFPRKEFQILLFLASHRENVVNRETLLNAIWGSEVYVVDRSVDVHIRKIREKLGKHAEYIETIKGVGYRMRETS